MIARFVSRNPSCGDTQSLSRALKGALLGRSHAIVNVQEGDHAGRKVVLAKDDDDAWKLVKLGRSAGGKLALDVLDADGGRHAIEGTVERVVRSPIGASNLALQGFSVFFGLAALDGLSKLMNGPSPYFDPVPPTILATVLAGVSLAFLGLRLHARSSARTATDFALEEPREAHVTGLRQIVSSSDSERFASPIDVTQPGHHLIPASR